MTFARGEAETARQEAETAQREAVSASRKVTTLQEQLEESDSQLVELQKQQHTVTMELELQCLHDRETLRKEFDRERKLMRETREQELLETREWRKEIVSERDQLRDRVERLEEQLACQCPGLEEGTLTDTRGLHAAEELDIPHAPGTGDEAEICVSGSGEQPQQEMEDLRTQLEDDAHPPPTQSTVVDSSPVRIVHFTQVKEGSHNKGLSPSPPAVRGKSKNGWLE